MPSIGKWGDKMVDFAGYALPLSMDGDLEQQKLERYRAEFDESKQQVDRAFNACFNNVAGMSAGEAFDYYESTR